MAGPDASSESMLTGPFPYIVAGGGLLAVVVWAGASLASALHGSFARIPVSDAGAALVRLPSNFGDPAMAWTPSLRASLPSAWLYWTAQLLVIVAAALLVVGAVAAWRALGQARPKPMGVDPEGGLGRRRDLRRLGVNGPTVGRLTVGRSGGRLIACEPQASLAVIGPTGCGKTAGFAIPALLEWQGPVLATSVKADLIDDTIEHRRGRGKVWIYDPTGISGHVGNTWNLLGRCRTWAGAMQIAAWMAEAAQPRLDSVTDGDYWYTLARKGLSPYLYAAALADKDVAKVVAWIDAQEQDEVEGILRRAAAALPEGGAIDKETGAVLTGEALAARRKHVWEDSVEVARGLLRKAGGEAAALAELPTADWPAYLITEVTAAVETEWLAELAPLGPSDALAALASARALWAKDVRLRDSVYATIENVLAGWADPGAAGHAPDDAPSIDIDEWLSGDNTVYVVATAHEQHRLRPVLTVLTQYAVRTAYDTATRNSGRLPHPCLLLLDEAGNAAPLRDLPSYASTARSHGISLVTVWQDLAQIKAIYGDRANTVLNNHRAKLFGAGIADADTLEYVSRLVGDHSVVERNVSADVAGSRRSVTEHRTHRRLLPMDLVRRIRPGEGVLVYGSELPAHVRLRPWFSDRGLRALSAGTAAAPAVAEEVDRADLHG